MKDGKMTCMGGYCGSCRGVGKLVLGLAVLANIYWLNWPWGVFIGVALAVAGLAKLMKPSCGHCM